MAYVVSLTGFEPGARYDSVAWTQARIEEATSANGPWTALVTQALSPVDSDPTNPQTRNLTTSLATLATGWYRIVWLDAISNQQESGAVYSSNLYQETAGLTLAEMRTQVKVQGGFDVSDAVVDGWINERYKQLVARSGWYTATVSMGNTSAGVYKYPIDPDVVDLHALSVGGVPYDRVGHADLWRVRGGTARLQGYGGVFAPEFLADGSAAIAIHPEPTGANAIEALVSSLPGNLSADADVARVPADFHEHIVEGAIGIGLARIDERLGEADRFEARFNEAVDLLRSRKNSRIGSGAVSLRVGA